MANGIKAPGIFIPGTKKGVVVESKFVKGGYITVSTPSERDELLKTDVITPGTRIFVESEKVEYICQVNEPTGQKVFKNSFNETVKGIESQGFVREEQVTDIVSDTAQSMVTEAVETIVPSIVDDKIDAKMETVADEIAEEATAKAKEETLKQVESQLEEDFVSDSKFTAEMSIVKSDVENLQESTTVAAEKIAATDETVGVLETAVGEVKQDLSDNYYTKADIDSKISGVYHYRGAVDSFEKLPTENVAVGDVYNVKDTGMNYAWTSEGVWDALGSLFDTDSYYDKEETDQEITSQLNSYTEAVVTPKLDDKADKSALTTLATKAEVEELSDSITYGEF